MKASDVAAQINLYSSLDSGVTASVSGGKLTLTAADGSDIKVQQTVAGATVSGTGIDVSLAGTNGSTAGTLPTCLLYTSPSPRD